MQCFARKRRVDARRAVAIGLLIAALSFAAIGVSGAAGQSAHTWRNPDGNPLPFQNDDEVIDFLQNARIESVADIELGVTNPRRVVLERGGVRMHAALRDYDETFEGRRFDGVYYARLRDSYVFDVAAFELAKILGVINIPPVTFRRIGSSRVSLQAWLEGGLMETDRLADDIDPPSFQRYRLQLQEMRVFDSLIGNVDRNSGNILFDGDWNLWLIDHSRAFPRNDDPKYLERIQMCSEQLFAAIRQLTAEQLMPVMSPPLSASEVNWVIRRRDKVVERIEALIAERGEDRVLFEGAR